MLRERFRLLLSARCLALVHESTTEIIFIPGGSFRMGSDKHYPEEAPAHQVTVGDFWIDRTPVTNRQFRKFVNETGHVTFAERPPDPKIIPARCRICSRPAL